MRTGGRIFFGSWLVLLLASAIGIQGASASQTTGGVASASLYWDGSGNGADYPANAFDGIKATDVDGDPGARYSWAEWPTAVPQWLQYEFDNPKAVTNYSIFCSDHVYGGWGSGWLPKSWILEGQAADSSDWVLLDTQNDAGLTVNVLKSFPILNHTLYKKYRLTINSTVGGLTTTYITELELDGTYTPASLSGKMWTGTGNWTDGSHWSPAGQPDATDDVTIAGTCLLDASATAAVVQVNSGGTLVFSNWDTLLTATNVTVAGGGKIKCAGPFTESQTSNRVNIACADFFVDAGGSVDVSTLGWAAGAPPFNPGNGPGKGDYRSQDYSAGAGYGGRGGRSAAFTYGGATYGSAEHPSSPGSGSGTGANGWGTSTSGHGGGAIRINASGTVTVNGTIAANGGIGSYYGGAGGSGGGIWITCLVFAGTNGSVQANGGGDSYYSYAGLGGGGRISVEYDTGAQASADLPSVRFAARPGVGNYYTDYYSYFANPSVGADVGTLYFPDNRLLAAPAGEFSGMWMVPTTNIFLDSLCVTNGWLRFRGESLNLVVSNNITVSGSGTRLDVGGDGFLTNSISLAGFHYNLGLTKGPTVRCGGDMILTNGANLYVFAGMTNGSGDYAALFATTGTLSVAAGSWVYPWSHNINGGSPKFEVGSLSVAPGGGFNADYNGCLGGMPYDAARGYVGYGAGHASGIVGAAGYGGKGAGYSFTILGGMPYGSISDPTDAGSGGSTESGTFNGGAGGGLIWISATGAVTMCGTLSANGGYGGDGGASGGGVNVRCATFAGTSGVIRAEGGSTINSGGGGGRIAIVPSDAAAQAALPKPRVVLSAARGAASPQSAAYDMGTIYLGDSALLDGTWLPHTGQIQFGSQSVSFDSLTITNGNIRFSQEGLRMTVTNDLTVSGATAHLGFGGNKTFQSLYMTFSEMLSTEPAGVNLAVGGNLIVTNSGNLVLYAGMTNETQAYGAEVTVGRTIFVATNCWISPISHLTNGGSVCFRALDVMVLTNGGFNADASGFKKAGPDRIAGYGPGGSTGSDSGGGYGGVGGLYNAFRGGTYGSSNAPIDPGSGGSGEATWSMRGGNGGGLIRIHATNNVTVNGTLTAVGQWGSSGYGCGSGGGIYVTTRGFWGDVGGALIANGGSGAYVGGGGGRIAVVRMPNHTAYSGTYSANAGTGNGNGAPSNGTVVVLDDPSIPRIDNMDAVNVTAVGADMVGNLVFAGSSPTEVYVYWGTNDGEMVKGNWNTNSYLGTNDVGVLTNSMPSGLLQSTKYYYRFYAVNAAGDEWALSTTNFSTRGAVGVSNDGGATNITQTSATLRGVMLGGSPTPDTYVCWGTDHVTEDSTSAWEHVDWTGVQPGNFSDNVAGLLANQTYYYRCYATNLYGGSWAADIATFTTRVPHVTISDVQVVKGPESTTIDAVFMVTLSSTSAVTVTMTYATADGTAAGDVDYQTAGGTLTFAPGVVSQPVTVQVIGGSADHWPSQSFFVNLSGASGAVIDDSQGLGTIIVPNDVPETKIWTGTGNWNSLANWNPSTGLPSPSDLVIIQSGTCTLSNSQVVASLVVSNGASLVFTNWMTKLTVSGDIGILSTGTITLPVSFTNNMMSNRVWIACSNLSVATGGSINVDGKGYAGGARQAVSFGMGPGGGGLYSGGSYGGIGGSYGGNSACVPYGVPETPEAPGSGGGGDGDSYGTSGGGAVRIEAGGQVIVNGSISANGDSVGGYANGSGGGIYITCRTFGGADGVVRANAALGNANYSFGGGGRIAVVCDAAAQQAAPKARVTFSAAKGPGTYFWRAPNMGTLYFSDPALLDETWIPHTGQLNLPGALWVVNNLTITNGWLRFAMEGARLTVSNDLLITGTSGQLDMGGNYAVTNPITFLYESIYTATNGPTLSVGRNLVLTNGAALTIYAGQTNAANAYGAVVDVGGDLVVNANSWIYPHSHPVNGGSPIFRVLNLTIPSPNSGINADYRGYRRMMPYTGEAAGMGPGGGGSDSGAGYGGIGGYYAGQLGQTYGSSNAPVDPGSGGGCEQNYGYGAGNGGGLIRIEAARTVRVNGTLSANGQVTMSGYSYGCGSGGGIYVRCKTFAGDGGVIRANGASGYTGGGGGRIAIWRIPVLHQFTGTITVSGGTTVYGTAGDGTIAFGDMPTPGTFLLIR